MSELEIEIPPGEPVIAFRRVVEAPPDLVFRMYTEPEHLRRWWVPGAWTWWCARSTFASVARTGSSIGRRTAGIPRR
jgi:uncharacterized protein YndB with AHSA1/START domain